MNTNKEDMHPIITTGGQSPVWLYQVLEAPLPTYTPTIQAGAVPKSDVFNLKEQPAAQGTPAAIPVSSSAAIHVPQDNPVSNEIAPFLPEQLTVKTVQMGDKLLFYPVIHYDSALSNIKPEFRKALDEMATILKTTNAPILIEGHTDSDPISTKKFKSNYELSVARAEAVKTYLRQVHGIADSRMTITGYGDTKPLRPNDTKENKYNNRRAEVMVISVTSDTVAPVSNTAAPVAAQPAPVSPAAAPTAVPTAAPVKVQTKKSNKSTSW
jgi:outer membrane protein OmpA-like peptidoglycan-associated protein